MVEQEIIKSVVKMGNSACVLLPKSWLDGKARVELIEKPLNIKKDIIEILEDYLEDVIGIYIVGSYARGEQTPRSDVDILVITHKTNKRIKKGRYEIILITKKDVEYQLKENVLPILPMLKEAKPLINTKLIEDYKNAKLTKRNLKWHIDTTKSAMGVARASIKLSKEMGLLEGDASAYSLILRLRTLYIINCLRKNKLWKKKEFLNLIKKIAGSLVAYEEYLRIKNGNKKLLDNLPIIEAEKLMDYINKEVREIEKCLKERKD